jgi:hypothetical protein
MKPVAATLLRSALQFLSWWMSELTTILHDVLAHVAPGWRRHLTAYISRQRLRIVDGESPDAAEIVSVSRKAAGCGTDFEGLESNVSALERGRRIDLVFDTDFAFIQRLRMPLAVLPHIDSAVNLQLPRLLPINTASLRTTVTIASINADSGLIDVRVAAVKSAHIEVVERTLEGWGLRPRSVRLRSETQETLAFKFSGSRPSSGSQTLTRTDFTLALTAAMLAVSGAAVFAIEGYRAQSVLDRDLMLANTAASSVLEQRQRLIKRLDTIALPSIAERAPSAAAVLADVTTHVGHESWLTTFELKGRELRLIGLSPDPAVLVKSLSDSILITNVGLRSSMAAAARDRYRFEITAQVKAGS